MKPLFLYLLLLLGVYTNVANAQDCSYATAITAIPYNQGHTLGGDSLKPSNVACGGAATSGTDKLFELNITSAPVDLSMYILHGAAPVTMRVYNGCPRTGGCQIGPTVTSQQSQGGFYVYSILTPGTYYIAVQSAHPSATTFTLNISYTTIPNVGCYANASPANNSHVLSGTNVSFGWSGIVGQTVTQMELYLGTSPSSMFLAKTFFLSQGGPYTLPGTLPAGDYYWYLVPRNANGSQPAANCAGMYTKWRNQHIATHYAYTYVRHHSRGYKIDEPLWLHGNNVL